MSPNKFPSSADATIPLKNGPIVQGKWSEIVSQNKNLACLDFYLFGCSILQLQQYKVLWHKFMMKSLSVWLNRRRKECLFNLKTELFQNISLFFKI